MLPCSLALVDNQSFECVIGRLQNAPFAQKLFGSGKQCVRLLQTAGFFKDKCLQRFFATILETDELTIATNPFLMFGKGRLS
jgi:hypothetical protein